MPEPLRQCVACKQRKTKNALLRIVKIGVYSIAFDATQKMPGRGLYVCPGSACIEKMKKREIIVRTWGIKPPHEFYIQLAQHIHPRQSDFTKILGFAARSRKLVTGLDAVITAAKKRRLHVIILDVRAGDSTRKRIESACRCSDVPLLYHYDEVSIEQVTGKANCKCAGITDADFVKSMLENKKLYCRPQKKS